MFVLMVSQGDTDESFCTLVRNGSMYTNILQDLGLDMLMHKVKVLSLPETIKENWTFRAKALRREVERPWLETSIFPLLFLVVREPFAYL